MKKALGIGVVVLLAGLGGTSPAVAQGELDRLESGIRASNGQPAVTVAAGQRVYLGAVADNAGGRGVILYSVRSGGPADRAGLKAQDLIVGAAGRKIHMLTELSAILNSLNPGDRLSLEFVRGTRPLQTDVVLAAVPGGAQLGTPGLLPPSGLGAGHAETIPPPPGEVPPPISPVPAPLPAPSPDGPAFNPPNSQPSPPKSQEAQIAELSRRVEQLERKVEDLERALAESRRK